MPVIKCMLLGCFVIAAATIRCVRFAVIVWCVAYVMVCFSFFIAAYFTFIPVLRVIVLLRHFVFTVGELNTANCAYFRVRVIGCIDLPFRSSVRLLHSVSALLAYTHMMIVRRAFAPFTHCMRVTLRPYSKVYLQGFVIFTVSTKH